MESDILRVQVLRNLPQEDSFHQDAELFFVVEGSLEISMGQQRSLLREEDIFIVNLQKATMPRFHPTPSSLKSHCPFN